MKILSKWVGAARRSPTQSGPARRSLHGPAGPTYTSMATMNRVSAAMTQAVTNI